MVKWPKEFLQFIEPDCDRLLFIQNYLSERGVKTAVVKTGGYSHICVVFPQSCYTPFFRMKTVVAHYDRVAGTVGANDNSAAVFAIMNWVCRMNNPSIIHNVNVVFTDGEEAGGKSREGLVLDDVCANSGGIKNQGAYSLGKHWIRYGRTDDDIFVFDCCGRGTIPVLGKTVAPKNAGAQFKKNLGRLLQNAESVLRGAAASQWITAPLPFSDNAGFIASGLAAVQITFLPVEEASAYMMDIVKILALEYFVVHKKPESGNENEALALQQYLPKSWKMLHSNEDCLDSLTAESFSLLSRILDSIASFKPSCQ